MIDVVAQVVERRAAAGQRAGGEAGMFRQVPPQYLDPAEGDQVEPVGAVIEQVVAHCRVAGVVGPSGRGRFVVGVAQWARSVRNEDLGRCPLIVPGRLVQGGGAVVRGGVRIGAETQHAPQGGNVAQRRGRLQHACVVQAAGRVLERGAGGSLVAAHAGGPKTVLGAQLARLGSAAHQHLGDLAKAVQQRVLVVGAPVVVVDAACIGAMSEQQRHSFGEPLGGRVTEDEVECPYLVVGLPVDPGRGGETAFEQELEPAVVGPEYRVVEPLRVVGIRPRVEQHRGQCPGMRVRRLADDAALAFAHRTGKRGKPVGAVPHEVRVRVGPVLKQEPRGSDGVGLGKVLGDTRITQVEQRRPVARAARRRRPARIPVQEPPQRSDGSRRRCGMHVGRGQRWLRRQHLLRGIDPCRRIVAVGQAGEVQELFHLTGPGSRDQLIDVLGQPAPARESVFAGDHELGVGQHGEPVRARMMFLNARANAVGIVTVQAQKLLGLFLDAGQTRPRR